MKDFSLNKYINLLDQFKSFNYTFKTLAAYFTEINAYGEKQTSDEAKIIILRHDIDKHPKNALKFAHIQHSLGIKGSYYFRTVPESWNEEVIKEIESLGHEIGYHYENMHTVLHQRSIEKPKIKCRKYAGESPDISYSNYLDAAYQDFVSNLEKFREIADIQTISMHGSYTSKYDNKAIWEKYDYKKLGILGEPYLDIDYNEFFYLTDTGRKWNGWDVSFWDKVPQQEEWIKQGLVFKTTQDIINAAQKGSLPNKILFTFHPQRWTDNWLLWTKELILQNAKNQVKRFLVKK